jgi:hypothetical protein
MMGHREKMKSAAEYDVLLRRARRLRKSWRKSGGASVIKKRLSRRVRRETKALVAAGRATD